MLNPDQNVQTYVSQNAATCLFPFFARIQLNVSVLLLGKLRHSNDLYLNEGLVIVP